MINIQNLIDYYKRNSGLINNAHLGKIIIIGSDMLISDYETPSKAYFAGVKTYGYGNFLMKDLRSGKGDTVNMINPSITTTL